MDSAKALVGALIFLIELVAMAACVPHSWPVGGTREQVRRAAGELDVHTRHVDYAACPYQPALIVARIRALESQDAWNTLCRELAQLPDAELELFEDTLRKPENGRKMGCAGDLLARIDAHWRAAAARLDQAHPRAAGEEAAVPLLASRAIRVDTRRDEVLVDGGLGPRQIAITFDDGPHPSRTPRILSILAAAGIKANFFQIGRNAAAHPAVARQVMDAGHTVGSHTYSHPDLASLSEAHAELEIETGDSAVSSALGKPGHLPFFRFPYGSKSAGEARFVRSRGDTTLFWNMDSLDWRLRDPHELFRNLLAELDRAQRGILLLHDIQEQTVIVVPHLLWELKERGYETVYFVPAS